MLKERLPYILRRINCSYNIFSSNSAKKSVLQDKTCKYLHEMPVKRIPKTGREISPIEYHLIPKGYSSNFISVEINRWPFQ